MLFNNRPDGTQIKTAGMFKLLPYLMKTRTESSIYFEQKIDVSETLEFLAKINENREDKITFFELYIAAVVRTVAQRPLLNRFVCNKRYYQRNNISVNFIAKKSLTDEGEESNVTVFFSPFDTLYEVADKVSAAINKAKSDEGNADEQDIDFFSKMPHWMINFVVSAVTFLNNHNMLPAFALEQLPFYNTIFISHLGSIGIDAPFHHNFEFGTTSLFSTIGRIREEAIPQSNGTIETRKIIKIDYTHDDRVCDGFYCARGLHMVERYIKHPERLLEKLKLTDSQLASLKLKEFSQSKA